MKHWIRQLAVCAFLVGTTITVLSGLALGLSLPVVAARGLVVGLVIYMMLALLRRLAARAIPRLAPEDPDGSDRSHVGDVSGQGERHVPADSIAPGR